MASEFFAEGGNKVSISLTPGDAGVLTVDVAGERVFDKQEYGGHPDLNKVKEMRAIVRQKVESLE